MLVNTGLANELHIERKKKLFAYFAGEQKQWFDKGLKCIFSIVCGCMHSSPGNLCVSIIDRALYTQRDSTGSAAQNLLGHSLTHPQPCLLNAANALQLHGWGKKHSIPYQEVKLLRASPPMTTVTVPHVVAEL